VAPAATRSPSWSPTNRATCHTHTMTTVLDPTSEVRPAERALLQRPRSLDGHVVALLDISKPRGDVFLNRVEERIVAAGGAVKRYRKPTFTKPAPVDLRHEIATQCTLVIEALAD
jgi:hypothetical protein